MQSGKTNMVEEPKTEWGGNWTEQKLDAFIAYVKAYLTIMNKNTFWKTIYFDGFAGAGEMIKSHKDDLLIPFEEDLPEELNVYKGSVKRILETKDKLFNYYYFIDKNPSNISSIEKIVNGISHIDKNTIALRTSDCNEQILKLAEVLKKKKHAALVFVDPFGMQIDWSSIASLKGTRSDIWILIPSGVAINRLLPRSGQIKNVQKLEAFFGMPIAEVRAIFYKDEIKQTLFGEMDVTEKLAKPIERISELYQKQMSSIWDYVTPKPLILKNTRGLTIFHFLFASNNQHAMKIASSIIEKRQK